MDLVKKIIDAIDRTDAWEGTDILERNEFLKKKGTTDTKLYFVVSGSMRIFVEDENEEQTIRFAYQNDLITALDSFITEGPSELYIQAIKKSQLKVLSKERFMAIIEGSEELSAIWKKLLGVIIFQQMERERDLLTSSPKQRYDRVLARSPQLFQEVPHKYIASYLRMTPETLSRIKKS